MSTAGNETSFDLIMISKHNVLIISGSLHSNENVCAEICNKNNGKYNDKNWSQLEIGAIRISLNR
jgi:hypothetical protein